MRIWTLLWATVQLLFAVVSGYVVNEGTQCVLYPEGKKRDDSASIQEAFELCGTNGTVSFTDDTFYVNRVMNTTGLENCDVEINGTLIWSTNVPYWLSHSYPLYYQNQSTAWLFGGNNVSVRGHGQGTFFGNGQTWYDENRNNSNQPGRPISITFQDSTNLFVDGLTFYNNMVVNTTSSNGNQTINTDGFDTWDANEVYLYNWDVTSGDDCIAFKGNTTNLYANNITCNHPAGRGGIPIGSIAQYPDHSDIAENITVENVRVYNGENAAWIKTFPGLSEANKGLTDSGGGPGRAKNITFRNFYCENVSLPIYVTQCTYSEGGCDTSRFQIEDFTWQNFTGTSMYNMVASIACSASLPCPGMQFIDIDIEPANHNTTDLVYQCAHIAGQNTTDTGIPCNAFAPPSFGRDPGHYY